MFIFFFKGLLARVIFIGESERKIKDISSKVTDPHEM